MEETGIIAPLEENTDPRLAKCILLSVLMTLILAGALPFFSYFLRSLTWLIWLAIALLIYLFSKELPIWRLVRPAVPYLAWLLFYLLWGLIVSPITDLQFAVKVFLTTSILGLCMAILTADPQYLRTLASAVQFAVVANCLVLMLVLRYPGFAAFIQTVYQGSDPYTWGLSRFGGLWGNPNMAGYICLIATILSVFALPWIAWLGRLSCLPLLYLASSRKALVLYLLILVLYLLFVQARTLKFWVAALTTALALMLAFLVSDGPRALARVAARDATMARVLDLEETEARRRGEDTRLDLLHHWATVLAKAPWYGFGLQAMAGTIYDEKNPQQVVSKGLFPLGSHNTYLGVLIDVGPIGLLAFLMILLHYARRCLLSGTDPISRWLLISFLICNVVILLVSHNHLFCFEGKITFTLLFLLPTSEGLRNMPKWLNLET